MAGDAPLAGAGTEAVAVWSGVESLGSRESEWRRGQASGEAGASCEDRFRDRCRAREKRRLSRQRAWRRVCGLIALCTWMTAAASAMARDEPTVEQLKASVTAAKVADKAKLCVLIAEKQLSESDRLYAASDYEKAQAALMDVVTYAELARDYAIQSHKYEKQTEIAARGMTRKLNEIRHSVSRDDQPPLEDAISRLERVRDDLQSAMFKKGAQ